MNTNDLLYNATVESNRIEGEPTHGLSFDNHWRCTLLARTAAEVKQLLHPRVYHQLLFEGRSEALHRTDPGCSRPLGMEVAVNTLDGRKLFAPSRDLPQLMRVWWARARSYESFHVDRRTRLWDFHAWFEAIHPFEDGNGRVGRLLWWNMAMIAGEQIEVVFYSERGAYYNRLDDWSEKNCNRPSMNPFG